MSEGTHSDRKLNEALEAERAASVTESRTGESVAVRWLSGIDARKVAAFFAGGVLIWLYVVFGANGLVKQYERYHEREQLSEVLDAEIAESERLALEIEALANDPLEQERAVRSELDYRRPGELVIIVEDDDPLSFDSPKSR